MTIERSATARIASKEAKLAERRFGVSEPRARYQFDSFQVAPCNRAAYIAARRQAEAAASEPPRPLLIVGGRGEGKTHLLHAIAHRRQEFTGAKLIRGHVLRESMRERNWADISAQMADDSYLPEAFAFDSLEALLDAPRRALAERMMKRQVNQGRLIAASISDDREKGLRLEWARRLLGDKVDLVEIGRCDSTLRGALLVALARETRPELGIDADALALLGERLQTSPRRLSSAYHRLCAQADAARRHVTRDFARGALSQLGCDIAPTPSIEQVVAAVAARFHVDASALFSAERRPTLNRARRAAMYLADQLTDCDIAEISARFNDRDADLVRAARKWVEAVRVRDGAFDRDIEAVRGALSRAA